MSGWQALDLCRQIAADASKKFVIIKASEGQTGSNSKYADQMAIFRATTKMIGAYHFGWLSNDPFADLRNFTARAQLRIGEVPILDVEEWGVTDPTKPNYARDKAMRDATPWSQRLDYTLRWLEAAEKQWGCRPWVYANWNYIHGLRRAAGMEDANGNFLNIAPTALWQRLIRFPLWEAQYRAAGTFDVVSGGWATVCHQYTDKPYDMNWMPGGVGHQPHEVWWAHGIKQIAA